MRPAPRLGRPPERSGGTAPGRARPSIPAEPPPTQGSRSAGCAASGLALSRSPGSEAHGHFGGPRQCLYVDIFPDLRHFAISNGSGEDPIVLVRFVRRVDFSLSDAYHHYPIPLRHEFGGFGYVISTSSTALLSTAANSPRPRWVSASGQSPPGMIHSISSATKTSRSCPI